MLSKLELVTGDATRVSVTHPSSCLSPALFSPQPIRVSLCCFSCHALRWGPLKPMSCGCSAPHWAHLGQIDLGSNPTARGLLAWDSNPTTCSLFCRLRPLWSQLSYGLNLWTLSHPTTTPMPCRCYSVHSFAFSCSPQPSSL